MVRWFAVAALSVTAAVLSPSLDAQQVVDERDFGQLCTPAGLLQACAHLSVWSEVNPATDTYLFWVEVANLQGRPGFEHLPASNLVAWYVGDVALLNCTRPDPDLGFPCDGSRASPDGWDNDLEERLNNFRRVDSGYFSSEWQVRRQDNGLLQVGDDRASDSEQGFIGCTPLSNRSGYDTCTTSERTGLNLHDGVRFSATDRSYVDLVFFSNDGSWTSCTTAIERTPNDYVDDPCIRVPEPSSLLLLASGVFGLAYVRRRRAA